MVMEVDAEDISLGDYANWLLETGIWDGRVVSWKDGPALQEEFRERFVALSARFESMAAQLAWLGATDEMRPLIEREIQELRPGRDGAVIQVGLGKSISRAWRHHKKEILIGIAVLVVVTAVVVVAVCTGGAGGAAVAAGGAGALGGLAEGEEGGPQGRGASSVPIKGVANSASSSSESQAAAPQPVQNAAPSPSWSQRPEFQEQGVKIGDSFIAYSAVFEETRRQQILSSSSSAQQSSLPQGGSVPQGNASRVAEPSGITAQKEGSFFYRFFQNVGKGLSDPELLDFNAPLPGPYVVEGPSPAAQAWESVKEGASSAAQSTWEGVKKGVEVVGRGLSEPELLDPAAPLPGPYESDAPSPIAQAWESVKQGVSSAAQSAWEGVKKGVEVVGKALSPPDNERSYSPFQNTSLAIFEPSVIDSRQCEPRPDLVSRRFKVPGDQTGKAVIAGINGINTTFEEAQGHALYLQSFTPNHDIGWVYNQTHGIGFDLAESTFLNFRGISIPTKGLLSDAWREFHEAYANNPNAKLLQYCHSQGSIHVYNALNASPPEIRNRVIVVAIAPAKTIPEKMCFRSFNYASKKDVVNLAELINPIIDSAVTSKSLEQVLKEREELILLDPHPEAKGIDHDFQSPTFQEVIKHHMRVHCNNDGEYK